MTSHALALAGQTAAQCTSQAVSQSPHWLQLIQACGAIATTVGVLVALYIVVIRDPREASEEHRHHVAQRAALQRARTERTEAHARKLVPSCARAPILGDSWWTVRIENAGNAATTILAVGVMAIDANGIHVPDGCRQAENARSTLLKSLESGLERQLTGEVEQAIRDTVAVQFVDEWPRTLPPNRRAAMAYTSADPSYRLRITVDYEDDEGFQWRRTDTGQPTRLDEVTAISDHVRPAIKGPR